MTTFTHQGWFLFCPVWIAGLDTPDLTLDPKWGLDFLLPWAIELQDFLNWITAHFVDDFEPMFCVRVSGPLKQPRCLHDD